MRTLCPDYAQRRCGLYSKLLQTGNVLADDVELEVDNRSDADVLEVGMLHGVGDDGYLKRVLRGVADGQRYAVNSYAALIDREVAVASHLAVQLVLEGEVGTAVSILHGDTAGGLVNVALHDVAVQTAVHQHGALDIHFVTNLQQSQV